MKSGYPGLVDAKEPELLQVVEQALRRSGYGELAGIECDVEGGAVVLRGTVSSYYLKQLAQLAALRVRFPGQVRNDLEVRAGGPR